VKESIKSDRKKPAAKVASKKSEPEAVKEPPKPKRVGNLAEFLLASPLRGGGIVIKRLKHKIRKIDL